ncbi:HNH endonuclease-domain-containing protein [Tuber brumale]|nr:HNH endonuclease-domain-containing protein [Tuber brumale]
MPHLDHSQWHDTFIYASDNRAVRLGGLWAGESFTNANFYSMLEVLCFFSDTFDVHDDSEQLVDRNEEQLQPGNYYIVTSGPITVNDEVPLIRTQSLRTGPRVEAFRVAVRERDGGCVITGRRAQLAQFGNWRSFEAAHIFPLAYEQHWNQWNYGRWITIPPALESYGLINSVQNGIMLTCGLHKMFDAYEWAINPDDNYKIICFTPNTLEDHVAGNFLGRAFVDNPLRPVDELLRWRFRQAVIINMKGAREPSFKTNFPPGADRMGGIVSSEKSAAGKGLEFFSGYNAIGGHA